LITAFLICYLDPISTTQSEIPLEHSEQTSNLRPPVIPRVQEHTHPDRSEIPLEHSDETSHVGGGCQLWTDPVDSDETSQQPVIPSIHERRLLDRSRLWNHRDQQRAYDLNLHNRVVRVFNAWENDEHEYGSLNQMAKDLTEISTMAEPAQPLFAADSSPMAEVAEPVFPDNAPAAGDPSSILDAESERHLTIMLEEFTMRMGNDERQTALSQMSQVLKAITEHPAQGTPHPLAPSFCTFSSGFLRAF
jgi:hypothetical protein